MLMFAFSGLLTQLTEMHACMWAEVTIGVSFVVVDLIYSNVAIMFVRQHVLDH